MSASTAEPHASPGPRPALRTPPAGAGPRPAAPAPRPGFEPRGRVTWEYHFAYCGAGFASRYLDDLQPVPTRPGLPALPGRNR